MKTKKLSFIIVSAATCVVLANVSRAIDYRDELIRVAAEFETDDPEVEYAARMDLLKLVSDATAPEVEKGLEKITEGLLFCLRSNDTPRLAKLAMLRELGRVGTARAVPQLSDIMESDDALLSENARKAIESIGGSRASSALRKAYSREDDEGKGNLIKSFGRRKDHSAVGFIGKVLKNEEGSIRLDAIWSLGEIGGKQAYGILLDQYADETDATQRRAIESALLALAEIEPKTLELIFMKGSDAATRRAALKELLNRRDERAIPTLRQALADADSDMQSVAIQTALASGVSNYQSLVLNQAKGMGPDQMRAVLAGLSFVDKRTAEGIAIQAFNEGDELTRSLAIRVLGDCGSSSKSINLLLDVLAGKDKALKLEAGFAIGKLDSKEMDRRLARMLSSNALDEVEVALEAVEYRSIPNVKKTLLKMVDSGDSRVMKATLGTLSVIADEADLEQLLTIAQGSDDEKRRLITALLKKLAPTIGTDALQAKVELL